MEGVEQRVSVPEAFRRTGVPGDQIYLAVLQGRISEVRDEHGFSFVLVDEVLTLPKERLEIDVPPRRTASPDFDPRRVSVPEAFRRTGVRGDTIIMALMNGRISHQVDDRGHDGVLLDEVLTLRDRAS